MKVNSKHIFISVVVFTIAVMSLHRISTKNVIEQKGNIVSVKLGGVNDAVFTIDNDVRTFYINRGFDTFDELSLKSLIGTTAIFYFQDSWSPLDPFNKASRNIVKLEINNKIFFEQ